MQNVEHYLGKESLSLISPEDHDICRENVKKCFEEPNHPHWINLRKPNDKEELYSQWEFKLTQDQEGNPSEVICFGHDIAPLILKQEELQNLVDITSEQNKRLLNFAYIISHNIRSHVANITGILEIDEIMESEEESKLAWNLLKDSDGSLDMTLHNLNEVISIQSNTNRPLSSINVYREIIRIAKSIMVLVDQAGTPINYNFETSETIKTNPTYFLNASF